MARLLQLISVLGAISSAYSFHLGFAPPDAILQAGHPAGLRAFIPDFPGCEMFSFHGKLNSPFAGDELGTFHSDILRPEGGLWTFQDTNAILSPGDTLHYWTTVVKDKIPYSKKNLTWRVPDPNDAVDFLTPSTLKPPKPTPLKMINQEMTTDSNEESTQEEAETTDDASLPTLPEIIATVLELAANKTSPAPPTTTTQVTTEAATTPSTKASPILTTTTTTTLPVKTTPATTKRPPTSEKPKTNKPKKSTLPMANPLKAEDVEELTTPSLPFEKPIATEFPQEPPLFPFPSLFPRPFKPMMPPAGPGFEICSNPWNFEEQPGESRAQRLERQVAKLQCELALFQRGTSQLSNSVENEINDLKKLIFGMVGRMARLESLLRTSAFG